MIRLYGTTRGHSSFARVTAGMVDALKRLGVLAGVVPLDAYDPEMAYPGWDAPTAVYVGNPMAVEILTGAGMHHRRLVLLPPNSSWMPPELMKHVAAHATNLLAPSEWARYIQAANAIGTNMGPPMLWQHGVDGRFREDARDYEALLGTYLHDGAFDVVHLTSTNRGRKGTVELLQAWLELARHKRVGAHARLRVVCNPHLARAESWFDIVNQAVRSDASLAGCVTWVEPANGMDVEMASRYYRQHHVVCQPSRGEGFGLVPLEARASGVPIVATSCTGHADHVRYGDPGVVEVEDGEHGDLDDGPGATAPKVSVESIAGALESAYDRWPDLARAALENAPKVREEWSWERVTARWLDTYQLRGG